MRAAFSFLLGLIVWIYLPAVSAQQSPAGSAGGNTGGANVGRGTASPPRPTNTQPDISSQRPIFISGKVVLDDGSTPLEPIKIQRVCSNTTRTEGYTDRKGRFSFEIGRSQEFQDASESSFDPFSGGASLPRGMSGIGGSQGRTMSERDIFGCEIRAVLAGFRSDSAQLSNIHYLDNPDLGTIVLHRMAKVDGLTVSATLALAPKDAKKAFEKGQQALQKRNPDEAQKQFEKAVELYPRHAAAWYEIGKIQEQRDHPEEARKSYEQSITADSKYIYPHQRLAVIALKESKWQELADHTDQVLRLDPIDYPDAYYLNGVANFQLNNYEAAQKQELEAIRLDSTKKMMRAYYILGLAQAQQQNFTASAQSLKTFLDGSAGEPDAEFVRKQLIQVEAAAQQQAQSSPSPSSAEPAR